MRLTKDETNQKILDDREKKMDPWKKKTLIWTLTLNQLMDVGIVLKRVERLFKHIFRIDVLYSKQIQHHAVGHTKRAQQRIRLALECHKEQFCNYTTNNWAFDKETITSLYATINITHDKYFSAEDSFC